MAAAQVLVRLRDSGSSRRIKRVAAIPSMRGMEIHENECQGGVASPFPARRGRPRPGRKPPNRNERTRASGYRAWFLDGRLQL